MLYPNIESLPVKLIKLAVQTCHAFKMEKDMCIVDMITIGLFFLCCPGEYTVTFDNKSFKLLSVQIYQDDKPISTQLSELLHAADFFTLIVETHTKQ